MDKGQWQKVRQIFDHVRDKSPSFRTNYLDMVCDDDGDLRAQVESMLEAHDDLHLHDAFTQIEDDRQLPASVGDYQIIKELGRGGMGVVYRAEHKQHGTVALKVLPARLLHDPRASQRFAQEATLLRKLDHPIICRIYETGVDDEQAFIAMDEIDGCTLAGQINAGALRLSQALTIAGQLADGLDQAHRAGVTHRDIKPSNILLDRQHCPHLIDFGIAKLADTRLTATGELMGSPAYMSPEQWRGQPVDARTDVWSLGIVLFEMLCGYPPFDGNSVGEVAQNVLSVRLPNLPAQSTDGYQLSAVELFISRMLEKDVSARLESMAAVANGLNHLMEHHVRTHTAAPE